MLVTPFYNGQGLGNQLANLVAVRCLAIDKGYTFGVMYPERFKGSSFMKLDMGHPVIGGHIEVEGQEPTTLPEGLKRYYREAFIDNGDYDHNFKNIEDNTLIHGLLQGIKYFEHRRDQVQEWLAVKPPLMMGRNTCVINFRGGEYKYVPEFFLPKIYWERAIALMRETNPNVIFEVHTDDPEEARKFFPDFLIIADIGLNWRSIRYARYLILSNSSFAILPAYLNDEVQRVIAPWGFGRHNTGQWLLKQNYVKEWDWLKPDGTICK
jgi:hypothetical protein